MDASYRSGKAFPATTLKQTASAATSQSKERISQMRPGVVAKAIKEQARRAPLFIGRR